MYEEMVRSYRFYVRRNGTYVPFLRTVRTVSTYVPFLRMKKRYVRYEETVRTYRFFVRRVRSGTYVRTVSSYVETVRTYRFFVRRNGKSSPQKSRPPESGHRRHGAWIAIEYSYKLGQKKEFKFLCELGWFLQIQSHIFTSMIGFVTYRFFVHRNGTYVIRTISSYEETVLTGSAKTGLVRYVHTVSSYEEMVRITYVPFLRTKKR